MSLIGTQISDIMVLQAVVGAPVSTMEDRRSDEVLMWVGNEYHPRRCVKINFDSWKRANSPDLDVARAEGMKIIKRLQELAAIWRSPWRLFPLNITALDQDYWLD